MATQGSCLGKTGYILIFGNSVNLDFGFILGLLLLNDFKPLLQSSYSFMAYAYSTRLFSLALSVPMELIFRGLYMKFKGDGEKGVFLFHKTNQTHRGKHNILIFFSLNIHPS